MASPAQNKNRAGGHSYLDIPGICFDMFWHVARLRVGSPPMSTDFWVPWANIDPHHSPASTVRGSHTTSLARDAVRLNKGTSALLQWWACPLDYTAPFMTDRYVTAWDTKAQKLLSKVKNGKSSTRAKNNLKWLPSLHMVSNVDVI